MWFFPGKILKKWLFLLQTVSQIELSFQGLCRQIIQESVRPANLSLIGQQEILELSALAVGSHMNNTRLRCNCIAHVACHGNSLRWYQSVQESHVASMSKQGSGPSLVVKQIALGGESSSASAVTSPSDATPATIPACFSSSQSHEPPVCSLHITPALFVCYCFFDCRDLF
jgi:hypothetical protein